MSNPITITVTAQTAQAAADLQKLAAQGSQSLAALGKTATEAGEHIAGMSYYFRSSIDAIRMAAMGGGDRAAFYAVDELTRGLVAQGKSIRDLIPIFGGLGIVIAGGMVLWQALGDQFESDAKKAHSLVAALQGIPDALRRVYEAQKLGALTPEQASKYAAYLIGDPKLGGVPLYVAKGPNQPTDAEAAAALKANGKDSDSPLPPIDLTESPTYAPPLKPGARLYNSKNPYTENLEAATVNQIKLFIAELTEKAIVADEAGYRKAEVSQVQLENSQQSRKAEDIKTPVSPDNVREQDAKEFAEANKQIEDQITTQAQQSGRQREAFYQQEYAMRVDLATRALYSGQISEDQYKDAVSEATAQLIQGQQKYNEELDKEHKLRQQIAQEAYENNTKNISDNPLMTQQQKTQALIPQYQQQLTSLRGQASDQYADIANAPDMVATSEAAQKYQQTLQQIFETQQKLDAAQGASSWAYQMKSLRASLMDVPTLMQSMENILKGGIDTGVDSIASNFTKVIEGTEKFRQALLQIEKTIATDLIKAIIKMGEQWVIAEILKLATSETVNTTAATTAGVTAALLAKLWEPAAVYSAIATDGVSLAAGVSAIAMGVFKEGGYTGDGDPNEVAGFVHRGEFVVPADVVRQHGLQNMTVDDLARPVSIDDHTAMDAQGRGMAGGYSPGSKSLTVNQHFYDERPHPRDYLMSSEGEHQIVNIANKNKRKIGIST